MTTNMTDLSPLRERAKRAHAIVLRLGLHVEGEQANGLAWKEGEPAELDAHEADVEWLLGRVAELEERVSDVAEILRGYRHAAVKEEIVGVALARAVGYRRVSPPPPAPVGRRGDVS